MIEIKSIEGTVIQINAEDLSRADLRGADISRAVGIEVLPVGDPRGYRPVAVWHGDYWMIVSGCRRFTIEQSRVHWGDSYKGDRDIGDRYLAAMDWLEKRPTPKGKN